jgi:hypothetical protein
MTDRSIRTGRWLITGALLASLAVGSAAQAQVTGPGAGTAGVVSGDAGGAGDLPGRGIGEQASPSAAGTTFDTGGQPGKSISGPMPSSPSSGNQGSTRLDTSAPYERNHTQPTMDRLANMWMWMILLGVAALAGPLLWASWNWDRLPMVRNRRTRALP